MGDSTSYTLPCGVVVREAAAECSLPLDGEGGKNGGKRGGEGEAGEPGESDAEVENGGGVGCAERLSDNLEALESSFSSSSLCLPSPIDPLLARLGPGGLDALDALTIRPYIDFTAPRDANQVVRRPSTPPTPAVGPRPTLTRLTATPPSTRARPSRAFSTLAGPALTAVDDQRRISHAPTILASAPTRPLLAMLTVRLGLYPASQKLNSREQKAPMNKTLRAPLAGAR